MLILRPDAEDEARTALLDRAKEIITARRRRSWGKIDEWGKRRFAYEIDHMTEGFYYVLYFEATPKTLDEVTRVLGITDARDPLHAHPARRRAGRCSCRPRGEAAPEE